MFGLDDSTLECRATVPLEIAAPTARNGSVRRAAIASAADIYSVEKELAGQKRQPPRARFAPAPRGWEDSTGSGRRKASTIVWILFYKPKG